MDTYKETHHRTIVKTLSWRVFASLTTVLIVFVFTRKIVLSLGIGLAEMIVKTMVYYFHERMWTKINFGKEESN